MAPEHPAGDEIAKRGCGDERNRDQENGDAVATFQFTNRLRSYGACQDWGEAIGAPFIHGRGEQSLRQVAKSDAQRREVPEKLRSPRWNTLLTGIGAIRQRRPPLIDWVTGHGFH
jgi:hypothetical protein